MSDYEQSAEELLAEALDLPPEERSVYLVKACGRSPELLSLVQDLLRDYRRMGDFLAEPAINVDRMPDTVQHAVLPGELDGGDRSYVGKHLGRYTVTRSLGTGGMGTVYRARDEKLGRDVAIKILLPGMLTGEETRRRFRREALALGKLNHSHIAAVYDVGEQDGVDYLVMECVAGETLAAKMKRGRLSLAEATATVLQVAQALEDAHEQGIVHRDLKPTNVMITPKGNVKVLDFGIAKLLKPVTDMATGSLLETGMLAGTPLYMSPEQAEGKSVDARTDLWSLGVLYYELLAGHTPFRGDSAVAVLHAIITQPPAPISDEWLADAPLAKEIITRALAKNPSERYPSAAAMAADASLVLTSLTSSAWPVEKSTHGWTRVWALTSVAALVLAAGLSYAVYHRYTERRWALEEAIPKIRQLIGENKPLAAYLLSKQASSYLPGDPQLKRIAEDVSTKVSVTSVPSKATVAIEDYLTPDGPWQTVGTTPLTNVSIPKGYFRWKISKAGEGEMISAPLMQPDMEFRLDAAQNAPAGMVYVPGGSWMAFVSFVNWMGPYSLPPYYMDRLEVTNREFQKFVDSGGYEKKEYWPETFSGHGRILDWQQAMAEFRDLSGRAGPSTWTAGHYPEGKGDYPVSGVSWFEASAYAAYVGKQLPILAQWLNAGPADAAGYAIPLSNIGTPALAPAGKNQGMGPFGTFDMVGNVREWAASEVDDGLRFIPGGSWKSPSYMAAVPESASPFDRSDTNGFRCVKNLGPLPKESMEPVRRVERDFRNFKPAPDDIFHAYELLYAYPKLPLDATEDGVVRDTTDWREEKVTFNTGYRGERMSAYLFLPKHVRPPFQTVIFFPSARVYYLPNSGGGRELGDLQFFDYILQSGRAVIYPIYEQTYERKISYTLPSGAQNIQTTTDWYKDTARAVDYLQTRPEIDSSKLAYLGVSMGAVQGVINATLLQDRLKTAILLDGGFFQDTPPLGGDHADFAPRLKMPVLMVNGRYDYVFTVNDAQNPLFDLLGTPPANRRHILLNTAHDVTERKPELSRNVLDWLDQYLGRVK